MKAEKITENIYWVGALDYSIRNFHGYLTQKGVTYNAYLIIDEKITLIDTVKDIYKDEMMSRIKSIIDPSKIDIIISNHVEPDHSGAIPEVLKYCPNATVVTCSSGKKGLNQYYYGDWNFQVVKTGDTISLGKKSLEFILTPMVHWPDNMMCYMPEEKILFSNDSFGQHYATSKRFDDEVSHDDAIFEAKKYYANIVFPFSNQVKKELDAVSKFDVQLICSSHGIIWRKYISEIVDLYHKWANNYTNKKVVIAYDTMWKSTEKMAYSLYEAFELAGYEIAFRNLQVHHESDVMTDILESEYICVGSPTLNNEMMTNVIGFLTYMRGLASKSNKKAIAFGSYGWNGYSIPNIEQIFKDCEFEVVSVYKHQYRPTIDDLNNIKQNTLELLTK